MIRDVSIREVLSDVWRLLWRRDSTAACCMAIGLSCYLSDRHLRELRDFYQAVLDVREEERERYLRCS